MPISKVPGYASGPWLPTPASTLTPLRSNPRPHLSALLVLMMIANAGTFVFYFAVPREKLMAVSNAPAWVSPAFGVLALANLVCMVGVWKFQKWGVYGVLGAGAFAFAVNFGVLSMRVGGVLGLLGPVTVLVLVRPVWRQFE